MIFDRFKKLRTESAIFSEFTVLKGVAFIKVNDFRAVLSTQFSLAVDLLPSSLDDLHQTFA